MRLATMRKLATGILLLAAMALCVPTMPVLTRKIHAQGYSLAAPNVTATAPTGLGLSYTAGTVVSGGLQTAITANTLTATNTLNNCAAPAYSACNIVYWTSGASLSITSSIATATVAGNVVVAFVTTTGGNINVITPASWNSFSVSPSQGGTLTDRYITVLPVCVFTPTTLAADTGTWPQQIFVAANQLTTYSYQTNTTIGTIEVTCTFGIPPSRTTASTGMTATSVDVNYAIVTTGLTTFANPTFSSVSGPATAGGAAAGTVASAGGTLAFTPATIQKAAITSGLMYRLNVGFGTAIPLNSSNVSYTVDFILTTAGTTKTRVDLYPFTVYFQGS